MGKSLISFRYKTGVMPVWSWHTGTARDSYTGCDGRIIWSYDINLMQPVFYSSVGGYMHIFWFYRETKKNNLWLNFGIAKKGLVPHKIRKSLRWLCKDFSSLCVGELFILLQLMSLNGFELFYEESYPRLVKIFVVNICCECNPFSLWIADKPC